MDFVPRPFILRKIIKKFLETLDKYTQCVYNIIVGRG